MECYTSVVQDRAGNALSTASVTVYAASGALATLYSDNGVTQITNPIQCDVNGEYAFFAAGGTYQLIITAPNYSNQAINGVVLYDPSDDPLDASNIAYDNTATYPGGSIGATIQQLVSDDNALLGTANQVILTTGTGTITLSTPQNIGTSSAVQFGSLQTAHIGGTTSTPTVTPGAGAGVASGGTITVTGDDQLFTLNISTGTAPTGSNAVIGVVVFGTAFANAPVVTIIPQSWRASSGQAAPSTICGINSTTINGFSFVCGSTALTASASYTFAFMVHGV